MFLHTIFCVDSMRSGKFLKLSALFQFNWLDITFANLSNFTLTNHTLNSLLAVKWEFPCVSHVRAVAVTVEVVVEKFKACKHFLSLHSSCSCISHFPSRLVTMLLLPSRSLCLTVDCENEIIWRPKSDFFSYATAAHSLNFSILQSTIVPRRRQRRWCVTQMCDKKRNKIV